MNENLLNTLKKKFKDVSFRTSNHFMWSSKKQTVYYITKELHTTKGQLALLHELGHAKLKHRDFTYDIELIKQEVDAWQIARNLVKDFNIKLNQEYIDLCLESYRIWLFKRSRCPSCENTGVQIKQGTYRCIICQTKWRVAANHTTLQPHRFCLANKYAPKLRGIFK